MKHPKLLHPIIKQGQICVKTRNTARCIKQPAAATDLPYPAEQVPSFLCFSFSSAEAYVV